jgi:hypothetical protein
MAEEQLFAGKSHAKALRQPTADELVREIAALRERLAIVQANNAHDAKSLVPLPRQTARSPMTDGILFGLAAGTGQSAAASGAVVVASSDVSADPRCGAQNAADCSTSCCFCTEDRPNQWISYDFRSAPITPVAYLIQSCNFVEGSIHPRSWVLEGSPNGENWTEIDRRTNLPDLNGPQNIGTFTISRPAEWRFVRLTQTQPNHAKNNVFAFLYFDLLARIPRLRFELKPTDPFNGLIAYLNTTIGGNAADRGAIAVTGTPRGDAAEDRPANAVDFDDCAGRFWSANGPGQTLVYDFKERVIVPTHYAIRSGTSRFTHLPYLRSWAIETSADGAAWAEIDRREGVDELDAPAAVATFEIAERKEARFVRIRQTGENHRGAGSGFENSLVISAWEIFGELLG